MATKMNTWRVASDIVLKGLVFLRKKREKVKETIKSREETRPILQTLRDVGYGKKNPSALERITEGVGVPNSGMATLRD